MHSQRLVNDQDMHYTSHMDLLNELGRLVSDLRHQMGWTRRQISEKSGLSMRFLADLESGKANISLSRLAALAGALKIPLATLVSSLPSARDERESSRLASILSVLSERNSKELDEAQLWLSERFNHRQKMLALIGLRGAGKTAIGQKVAAKLRWPFVELDQRVEKHAGLALQNIFEVHGEDYYRALERDALLELLKEKEPMVIAAGGGLVTRTDTYDILRRHCKTVWLKARPEDHWNRVIQQDPRPITNYPDAFSQLQSLLRQREPLYSLADAVVDTSRLGIKGSTQRVLQLVYPGRNGEKKD